MKALITTLAILTTLNSFAEVIHDRCWDRSFAYNRLTVEEYGDSYSFLLSGTTILNTGEEWENSNVSKFFNILKDHCQQSSDGKLINCGVQNIVINRTEFGEHGDQDVEEITLKIFQINIRYVEEANLSGFELVSHYRIKDSTEFTSNRTFFSGERDRGCEAQ